jgi:lipopolysaccharide heptosyltransferase I
MLVRLQFAEHGAKLQPFKVRSMDSGELFRQRGVDSGMRSADLRGRDFKKILLIKLSALGDVVHTMPVLNKLRRRYPAARVDWLTTPAMAELLRHNRAITSVIEFERAEWSSPRRLAAFTSSARLIVGLRRAGYDLVLDLQGQLRTALFARATGAPTRIGFDKPRAGAFAASSRAFSQEARKHAWHGAREGSWLAYTHHIPLPNIDVHAVDRYLSVGPMLGLDEGAADFSFPIPPEATGRIDALMDYYEIGKAKLIAIAPGTVWETKEWRRDGFADVARHFLQKHCAVTLIGSDREREVCAQVATAAPGAINLAGETTLSELAALIRRSTVFIGNDSGPMHLAVALDRPVVSIFGPTDPVWAGPYGRDDAVMRANLPCSPCYLRRLDRCTHAHACMQDVTAQRVIEQVEKVLPRQTGSTPTARASRR